MKTATNAMQQASVARTNLGRIWKFRHIYVFLLPAIVWYAIFCYYPMYGVLLAFKDYKFNLGILGSPWVGLKYFETFLTDSYFYIILKNTLAISLLKLICGFPAPILFALMINEVTHVKYKKSGANPLVLTALCKLGGCDLPDAEAIFPLQRYRQ